MRKSGTGACSSRGRPHNRAWPRVLAAPGLALIALAVAGGAAARDPNKPTPSSFPVPRWVSLKFGQVNARSGPGDDYPTVWVYNSKGLPVQVVEETREWRKVCDPDGQSAWIHRRTTDGARTVFRAKPQGLPLVSDPRPDARVRAYLSPRSIAGLEKCEGGWCRVKADGVQGWAPESELWGTGDSPHCR
ncbi:MAG TPA: SH3 domain-containing protein [Caulobacteraceae bacterium]|nr:SH3 domain-containing protein [Caulobacteraceae bacterium]